jgi:hypothetical protein
MIAIVTVRREGGKRLDQYCRACAKSLDNVVGKTPGASLRGASCATKQSPPSELEIASQKTLAMTVTRILEKPWYWEKK